MYIKHKIRKTIRKFGYDISRFTPAYHPIARIKKLFETYKFDVVLDIGANTGQFAKQIRDIGYSKRILSFEPLSSAFEVLKKNAKGDPGWEVFNYAIGDIDEKRDINIASNSFSSSLLDMSTSFLRLVPAVDYVGKEMTNIKTLDSIFSDLCETSKNFYMKIDTQGFENKVLKGADKSLKQIDFVQMEMSFIPLYKDEILFIDMCNFMAEKGYSLIGIETGITDQRTGRLLQVDGIFQSAASI